MKLIFKTKYTQASDAQTFVFTPQEPATWIAGQSIRLEMPGIYGPEERRFTISSAPYEQDIHVTTHISDSSFKQSLAALQPGTPVDAYAIEGSFTWQESEKPHLFVAGGIGVTPFYSMIKQRIHDKKPIAATLLYSHSTSDAVFSEEFKSWQKQNPAFKTVHFIGQRITASDVKGFLPTHNVVYVSGPTKMVDELSDQLLNDCQLNPARLMRDWFTGRVSV